MTIALVVPVLDERALVDRLCEQLRDASRRSEVVVVDGGSEDGTADVLEARAASHGFRFLRARRGRALQMNAGAQASTAPTLLFLHADTLLPFGAEGAVERAIAAGAIAGCFKLRIDSTDPRLVAAAGIINLRSRLLRSASGDQALFVTRRTFDELGGFRELALCEDLDLVQRLRGRGRFALVDDHVRTSARRWERGGVNSTIALMWALRLGWHLGVDPARLASLYRDDAR